MGDQGVRVEVDADICVGTGQWEAVAPDMFTFDDDAGVSRVTSQPEDDEAVATAHEAERGEVRNRDVGSTGAAGSRAVSSSP